MSNDVREVVTGYVRYNVDPLVAGAIVPTATEKHCSIWYTSDDSNCLSCYVLSQFEPHSVKKPSQIVTRPVQHPSQIDPLVLSQPVSKSGQLDGFCLWCWWNWPRQLQQGAPSPHSLATLPATLPVLLPSLVRSFMIHDTQHLLVREVLVRCFSVAVGTIAPATSGSMLYPVGTLFRCSNTLVGSVKERNT